MNPYIDRYVPAVTPARSLLESHPVPRTLLSPNIRPRQLGRFLIEYCARAVHLTEPVADWIRRAGAATRKAGFATLGDQLEQHAKHEEGHHLMLIEDTRSLGAWWNAREEHDFVDVEALLDEPPTTAAVAYINLHEETITSAEPYAQVAIELEIEGLSVRFGTPLVEQIHRVLGPGVMKRLSFIEEHVEVDVGHTALNEKMMTRLLRQHPHTIEVMADTGRRALEIYVSFLEECYRRAALVPSGA